MGFFPVDEESCNYLLATGRSKELVDRFRNYFKAQAMFGIPRKGEVDYTTVIELDLSDVRTSVAGPKRPQDRIDLDKLKTTFIDLLQKPIADNGYGKSASEINRTLRTEIGVSPGEMRRTVSGGGEQDPTTAPSEKDTRDTNPQTEQEMMNNRPTPDRVVLKEDEFPRAVAELHHGDIVIAAITSCTNTSNPSVMIAAGILAMKAAERGLRVRPTVKTSLAPGSRVVTEYLTRAGLMPYLNQLTFALVGYGCTTCIGNSGPLDPKIEDVIVRHDLVAASVLSGNRNFEARVHQSVRANFLMSPPLVVAFAIAGRVDIDMTTEPLGRGRDGRDVYLRDIWPSLEEIRGLMEKAMDPEMYKKNYSDFVKHNPLWEQVPSPTGELYTWPTSTYITEPPFFKNFGMQPGTISDIQGARALAIFGDSVTTDHISPAGAIKPDSPAGKYLVEQGVKVEDFNSYGARRGNDQVMTRGTFANVRIKNQMVPGVEGGVTIHQPSGQKLSIYDASVRYRQQAVPLMVFAGHEYGTGSSRDWAAKGTALLGVRAVIARSFERIHRSNLVGMGVLPCQFEEGASAQSLGITGAETYDLIGLEQGLQPQQRATLVIRRSGQEPQKVPVRVRIDTPIEVEYYQHGGILPYVLRQLLAA
jgi:aconitate hydratase A / 2-methylisocitrate dehydratase